MELRADEILQKQAQRYRELFEALKSNTGLVSAVVFWGIADDHTWLSNFPVTPTEAPLLFDKRCMRSLHSGRSWILLSSNVHGSGQPLSPKG